MNIIAGTTNTQATEFNPIQLSYSGYQDYGYDLVSLELQNLLINNHATLGSLSSEEKKIVNEKFVEEFSKAGSSGDWNTLELFGTHFLTDPVWDEKSVKMVINYMTKTINSLNKSKLELYFYKFVTTNMYALVGDNKDKHMALLKALIKTKVSPNFVDEYSMNASQRIAKDKYMKAGGKLLLLEILKEMGADFDYKNKYDKSVWDYMPKSLLKKFK